MALSDCLSNYIGLRGYCSDTTPESGLYVNDLPGISIKMMSNISNDEQKNYSGVWDEIYTRALNELETDVLIRGQKYFKTTEVADNSNTGYYDDPYSTSVSTVEFKGTTIEVDARTSRYLSIYLNSVQLYLPSAVNGSVFIYNLMNGELLDTITFTGTIGINTVEVNKSYITYGQDTKIFVCYNSDLVGNSIDVTSVDDAKYAITRGAKISTATSVLKDNLTFAGNSYGIIANYNLRCDINEFICSSKDAFKFAFLWKLGEMIMFERMTSDRMNKYTMTKTPLQLQDLKGHYNDKYDEIMSAVMDNLEANADNVCFSCRKKRNYKFNLP